MSAAHAKVTAPVLGGGVVELLVALEGEPHEERTLAAGEVVADTEGLWVLLEGELAVRRGERLLGFVEGPRVLQPEAFFAGRAPGVRWIAEGRCRLARWPWSVRPILLDRAPDTVVALLAEEATALRAAHVDHVRTLDDCFGPGAELLPGPYTFGPFGAAMLVMQAPPARLAALRPPGVRPLPGTDGRYLLMVAAMENARSDSPLSDGRSFDYREITPFLPCLVRGRPGFFVPELWPDAPMAVFLGREIYGFPKRVGRIRLDDRGADLIVDRERLLRARWAPGEGLGREAFGAELARLVCPRLPDRLARVAGRAQGHLASRGWPLPLTAFVRRRMLDEGAVGARRWREDELVAVPFRLQPASEVRRLEALDVAVHPRSPILCGRATAGFSLRSGFTFGAGRVVRRYRRSWRWA